AMGAQARAPRPITGPTADRGRAVNAIDLSVLGVIGLSAIFAFARGFVRETLSIVAWVGAALVTFYGFYPVSTMMSRYTSMPLLAHLIAGVGLFVISLIVLAIITGDLARFVHSSPLSAPCSVFFLPRIGPP